MLENTCEAWVAAAGLTAGIVLSILVTEEASFSDAIEIGELGAGEALDRDAGDEEHAEEAELLTGSDNSGSDLGGAADLTSIQLFSCFPVWSTAKTKH